MLPCEEEPLLVERGAGDRRRQASVGYALELPDPNLLAQLRISDNHQRLPSKMEPSTHPANAKPHTPINLAPKQIKPYLKKTLKLANSSILQEQDHFCQLLPEDGAVFLGEDAEDVRPMPGEQGQVPYDRQGRRPRHSPDSPVGRVEVEQEADEAGRQRGDVRQPCLPPSSFCHLH